MAATVGDAMMRIFLMSLLALVGCGETTRTTEEPAEVDYYVTTEAPAERVFVSSDIGAGIHIEYPSHWHVLTSAEISDTHALGTSIAAEAGIVVEGKQTLLAVNSAPQPSGALMRLSTTFPATITQATLEQAIRSGQQEELLQSLNSEFSSRFPAMMERAGVTVSAIERPQIVHVAGRPAVLIKYRRTSAVDGGLWEVRMYQIADQDRTVELTLSNRLSDRAIWRPILDRTLNTLTIAQTP